MPVPASQAKSGLRGKAYATYTTGTAYSEKQDYREERITHGNDPREVRNVVMKKKVLSIILLMILMASSFDIAYAASGDDGSTDSRAETPDYSQFETDENKIAATLREAMVNRDDSIIIKFRSSTEIDYGVIDRWMESALSETESPVEGDYLRFVLKDTASEMEFTSEGADYYNTITMHMTYYTTHDQENELSAELGRVMAGFNFTDSTSDYEKIKTIYNYICDNVTYDYENLYNDDYCLKNTAFAALINKTAVCQGYSSLLYRMLKASGVDSRIIAGYGNGENHAWNIVRIDGLYYYLDSTWDAGQERKSFFLRGSADFFDHYCADEYLEDRFIDAYPISENNYIPPGTPYTINEENITFYISNNVENYDTFDEDSFEYGWPVDAYSELSVLHGEYICENVTWRSSNSNIVTVDKNGVVKPVNHGTATVTGTYEGKDYICTVYVKDIQFFYWQVYTGEEKSNRWVWDNSAGPVVGKDLHYKLEEVSYDSNMKESSRVDVTQKYPLIPSDESFMQITPGTIKALKEGSSQVDETHSSRAIHVLKNTGVPYVQMICVNTFTSGFEGDWISDAVQIMQEGDGIFVAVPKEWTGFFSLDDEFFCIHELYWLTPEELTWKSSDESVLTIDKVIGSRPGNIYSTAEYSVHKLGTTQLTLYLNGKAIASLPFTVDYVDPTEDDTAEAETSAKDIKGTDGTAVGPGASKEAAEKKITSLPNDNDPAGAAFAPLMLRSTKQTNTSIKLTWKKVTGAKTYVIYGNKCGKTNKPKRLGKSTGSTKTIKKIAGKRLKKGTYYKFMVVALDSSGHVVSTSKIVHAVTKGGKNGNPTKVTVSKKVKKNKLTLKKGKTFKLAGKAAGKKVKKHVAVRYESSNPKIATVNKNGQIKGLKKGKCKIYVFAHNGVYKVIKLNVK